MSLLKTLGIPRQEKQRDSRIVADFPWLWALRSRWGTSSARDVRVSQNLEELRLVLMAASDKTGYEVSHFGVGCYGSEILVRVPRLPDANWCRAIMARTEWGHEIQIIATHFGEELGSAPIVLYRHPSKLPLNDFIQETDEIHGIRRGWRIILED